MPTATRTSTDVRQRLEDILARRILVLDGAMGTMVQRAGLAEEDFRGERFADHPKDLQGNNDLLVLTRPDVIRTIHEEYLAAGADVVETNTFSGTSIAQADYGLEDLAYEINREAARVAREACDAWSAKTPEKPRFVAGAIGPTNKTLSISPKVEDPAFRDITFEEVRTSYAEAVRGLIDGGADLLVVETIFDTLNAKAALFALSGLLEEMGRDIPIIVSGTITDASGRTLSGQTTEAFWNSIRHIRPIAVGLNCALGAEQLRPYVAELSRVADVPVGVHPNAGLPNEFGGYDQTPEEIAELIGEFAGSGLVNIVCLLYTSDAADEDCLV